MNCLKRKMEWLTPCKNLLDNLMELPEAHLFINIQEWRRPNGFLKVNINLAKVRHRLYSNQYSCPDNMNSDIIDMFMSVMEFFENAPFDELVKSAKILFKWYNKYYEELVFSGRRPTDKIPKLIDSHSKNNSNTTTVCHIEQSNDSQACSPSQNTNIVVSIGTGSGSCTILQTSNDGNKQKSSNSQSNISSTPKNDEHLSKSPSDRNDSSPNYLENVFMRLEASNIFIGSTRLKPKEPLILTEDGLTMTIQNEEDPFEITIDVNEMVRVLGNFEKSHRKTLFFFISPPCEKRIRSLAQSKQMFKEKDLKGMCSLVTIFIKRLHPPHLSKLIHIFWNMNKLSLFENVFSEINKKKTFAILAMIKPDIFDKMKENSSNSSSNSSSNVDENISMQNNQSINVGKIIKNKRLSSCTSVSDSSSSPLVVYNSSHEKGYSSENDSSVDKNCNMLGAPPISPIQFNDNIDIHHNIQDSSHEIPLTTIDTAALFDFMSSTSTFEKTSQFSSIGDDSKQFSTANCKLPDLSSSSYQSSFKKSKSNSSEEMNRSNGGDLSDPEVVLIPNTDSDESQHEIPQVFTIDDDMLIEKTLPITKCPITQCVMKNPVRNRHCNHGYDGLGVQHLISNRGNKARCPVPGCSNPIPLVKSDMIEYCNISKIVQNKKS